MKRESILLIVLSAASFIFSRCNSDLKTSAVDLITPETGGVGLLLQPTRPTVQLPNQMIRVYPVRADYLDDRISYFPLSIISHRNGELFGIMPFTGSESDPSSLWLPNAEISKPWYFSTVLQDHGITAEFTPGAKCGIFRFTFNSDSAFKIMLINPNRGDWKKISDTEFGAEESFEGMKAYAWCSLSAPSDIDKSGGRTFITLKKTTGGQVEFRYALSYISAEQARKNFNAELGNRPFEQVCATARKSWEKVIGKINIEGGTESQRRVFYTSLYRCYERMVNISEDGNYYSNYDSTVHKSGRNFYVDDWSWDTYLALHPLRSLLDPGLESDMIESYVEMYHQGGWLPTFPVLYGDTPCMNGFHSTIFILDAWLKGIRNFDIAGAYQGIRKNSIEATMLPWKNGQACSLDSFYREKGYYPALNPGEKETVPEVHSWEKRQAVAVTLGHSYDDWALSSMAKQLGKDDDYSFFLEKSKNYKKLWWPEKGFFMPKDKDGNWIDIDPKWDGGMGGRDYYDENNGWTYLWQVQHDIPGLIELMGGKKKFEEKLDRMFSEGLGRSKYENWAKFPDFSGIVGQFSMGNEPSFHIPYLYNFTDSPWKTQMRIRSLLKAWFRDDIFGIPGDEDGGGMSAFVVFSMMGFYPVRPGIPEYTIGSPVFKKVTVSLPAGKEFIIVAEGADERNIFVKSVTLNGEPLSRPFFTHDQLLGGGTIKFMMGPYPVKDLFIEK